MTFLFDIGNVIVTFDFISALKKLIPNENPENIEKKIHLLMEKKDEFEAGRISEKEYFPWAAQTLGFTGDTESFISTWQRIFSPNLPMWKTIKQLHANGHPLLLFSNIQAAHHSYLFETYPIFQLFNGGIFSYQTGHVKPEPTIYQIAIDQYNLTPSKTAYIDDLPTNIKAGKKAGFQSHTYRADQHSQFLQWLNALLK